MKVWCFFGQPKNLCFFWQFVQSWGFFLPEFSFYNIKSHPFSHACFFYLIRWEIIKKIYIYMYVYIISNEQTIWAELLSWIRSDSTSALSLLRKVATHSTIYNIWRQRNNQLHNQILIPASTVFRLIDRDIRNTLLGRRSKKNFRPLLAKWLM